MKIRCKLRQIRHQIKMCLNKKKHKNNLLVEYGGYRIVDEEFFHLSRDQSYANVV